MKILQGKTVLITGGTGSFGSKMLAAILDQGVGEVRVFSRDELKQDEMRIRLASPLVKFFIGDVRDPASVDDVMVGVDYVFHAAALKQVPSCEFFPLQAVQTNVLGSHNVVAAARAHGVAGVVLLSTDKAVYPVNAMGNSKALMEKVGLAAARRQDGGTVISLIRYGNVMYSRGSVIPLFADEIRRGLPLTVTEPGMTRFMMSLDKATDLVIYALENAAPGDLFVRKAPACTIGDLAQAMLDIFESEVGIEVIGTRHGEKIYETLATREELRRSEDRGDYLRVRMDDRDLNYDKYFTEGSRRQASLDDYTSHNTERLDLPAVRDLLLGLPEIRARLGLAEDKS